MHDRIDPGAPVVILLDLRIVREQPPHLRIAAAERQRIVGGHQEIDLAPLQHVAQFSASRRLGQPDVGGQLAAKAVGTALHPFHIARLDAVFMFQEAAHVDSSGHAVFRHAAALALEVARVTDALVGIDEEVTVAEYARRKRRDRDKRGIAVAHQRGVVRQRHLGRIEFAILQHAPEDFGGLQRQVIKLDAFGLQRTVAQGLGAVVGSASEGDAQFGHADSEQVVARMEPPGPTSGRPDDKLREIRGCCSNRATPFPGFASAQPGLQFLLRS